MTNENKINELKFDKTRFWIILILLLIGIGLCIELSYIFYKTNFLETFQKSFCSQSQLIDCDGVAQTKYSLSFGIPNSLWGLFLYSVMLMLLFVDRIQAKFKNTIFDVFKNPSCYITTLSLLAFALSMILAFISIFKIEKICYLCFITYFVDLFIAFAAKGKGFFINDIKTTILDFIDGAKKYFILFLILLFGFIYGLHYSEKTLIFSPLLKKQRDFAEFFSLEENKYAVKGNILGKKNADVVINIYSDFKCPFCRVVNVIVHKIAKERNVSINEINFPLDTACNSKIIKTLHGHETSCLCSRYSLAAKEQGKYWDVANLFFYKDPANDDQIIHLLKSENIELDYDKLRKDANSEKIIKQLQDDIEKTSSHGIIGTPTIEINGVIYEGVMSFEHFVKEIDLAKKRVKNSKNNK